MIMKNKKIFTLMLIMIVVNIFFVSGCTKDNILSSTDKTVPHEERWGIYSLDLVTGGIELIYSSSKRISVLRLSNQRESFVFSQKIDGENDEHEEICILRVDGSDFKRLTNNMFWDLYPDWSSDGTHISFLSLRENDLDIYLMDTDGSNVKKLYDSGSHDADIHWVGDKIVFTSKSKIWSIYDNGIEQTQVTDPPKAGQWGNANLPFGDYDPRLSPDGTKIVFERLEDDSSPHGNYNIYVINSDGTGEARLTNNGYSQGIASWSHSGDKIVYLVAAIDSEGKYDIFMMNADGTDNHNITPDYFPVTFLCHSPIFSKNDSKIFFIGEWWE